jgi:hypothetical protein
MITQQCLNALDEVYGVNGNFKDPRLLVMAAQIVQPNQTKEFYTGMLSGFCVALDLLNATDGDKDSKIFVGVCGLLL